MTFTIRDVLWLTVVVGLAVSWWLHAAALRQAHRELAFNYQSLVESAYQVGLDVKATVNGPTLGRRRD